MIKTLDLLQYDIQRPEKIRWALPELRNEADLFAIIKSKTLRSFLRTAEQSLLEFSITWETHPITFEEYKKWLVFYTEKMIGQEYDVIANEEWYQKKIDSGKVVEGIFFSRNGELLGSEIFITKESEKFASAAFKATDHRENFSNKSHASLGAVVDFFFLREVLRRGFTHISFGRSRNAFGVINTIGNLEYKLGFGYIPSQASDTVLFSEVPLNEKGIVLFFGLKENKLALYAVKPKELSMNFEQKRFATPELPFIEINY